MSRSIHPAVDAGVKPRRNARSIWSYINNQPKPGGKLTCKCTQAPVVVSVTAPAAHNHLCGYTKCWKPDDSLFSQIAVVPRDKLHVVKNRDKLKILDETVAIQRHYCSECGTHMYGAIVAVAVMVLVSLHRARTRTFVRKTKCFQTFFT